MVERVAHFLVTWSQNGDSRCEVEKSQQNIQRWSKYDV